MKTRKQAEKEKRRNELSKSAMVYAAFFWGVAIMAAIATDYCGFPGKITAVLEFIAVIPLAVMMWNDPDFRD